MGEKKRKYAVPLSICFVIGYLFLASRPLETEPALSPDWTVQLEKQGNHNRSFAANQAIPFTSGAHFGYVDEQGELFFCEEKTERLSLSSFAWSRYPARTTSAGITFTANQQTVISRLPGYPWLADNKIWIIAPEQQAISLIDNNGTGVWTRHFNAPITSLDASNGILLAGLLTGTVHAIQTDGTVLFSFTPGASRIEVIYGAALSPDARFMGLASGLDPQRVLLLERAGNSWKVVWHRFTETAFRRPVQLHFLDGGKRLLHEDTGGISIVDTSRRTSRHIPLEGTVLSVTDTDDDSIYFVLSAIDQTTRELTGIKDETGIFHQSRWSSDNNFLSRKGRQLVLGGKNSLAAIRLEEK